MLMTPARRQSAASKTCKLNWRIKKQPAAVVPWMGTVQLAAISGPIALRHHLSMILPTWKISRGKLYVKGCPPLPMAGLLPPVASTPKADASIRKQPPDNQETPRQYAFPHKESATRRRAIPSLNPTFRQSYNFPLLCPRSPRPPSLLDARTHTFRNPWIPFPLTSAQLY